MEDNRPRTDHWYAARYGDKSICEKIVCQIRRAKKKGVWVYDPITRVDECPRVEDEAGNLKQGKPVCPGMDPDEFKKKYKKISAIHAADIIKIASSSGGEQEKERALKAAREYAVTTPEFLGRRKLNGKNGEYVHINEIRVLDEHAVNVVVDAIEDLYLHNDKIEAKAKELINLIETKARELIGLSNGFREKFDRVSQLLSPILERRETPPPVVRNNNRRESRRNGRILSVLRDSGAS